MSPHVLSPDIAAPVGQAPAWSAATRIHDLFALQVARAPEAVALVWAGARLHYRELDEAADRLAHELRGLGVGPEVLVGVCEERSFELIIALLAVLKAGGAYLPLDPAYPEERLAFLLEDASPRVLLTRRSLVARLPRTEAQILYLDERIAHEVEGAPTARPAPEEGAGAGEAEGRHLAYVIYTSGSTGRPKGALIEHRGLCNMIREQIRIFGVRPESRVLQFAALGFDASISEIFMALAAGAELHLAPQEALLPGAEFLALLRERGITTLTLPPSVMAALPEAALPDLTTLIAAGEELRSDLVSRWLGALGAGMRDRRLFNAYGPTEATVCTTIGECQADGQKPSIGRPIAGVYVRLLDGEGRPVAPGTPGEIHIGGAGLARGYLHRPELTRERFIADPFAGTPGARLYRTGDLACERPDGTLEFLGRTDEQVKVRGFRIELGEIEAALATHPGVREVAVAAREDVPGERRLVAYVVVGVPEPTSETLRQFLRERLPAHMVPAVFVPVAGLPRTPNGKLDRRALPPPPAAPAAPATRTAGTEAAALVSSEPARERKRRPWEVLLPAGGEELAPGLRRRPRLAAEPVPPRSGVEVQLVEIWEEVLHVRPIGIRDDFTELGGDSFLGVRLVARINERLGQDLPMSSLLQGGTIERLAGMLYERSNRWPADLAAAATQAQEEAGAGVSPLVRMRPEGTRRPLFFVVPFEGLRAGNVLVGVPELVRHLDRKRPFYGIQPRSILEYVARRHVGLQATAADVDRLIQHVDGQVLVDAAAACVAALTEVQPRGPYLLASFCNGSVLAFEMAQQLVARGERVEFFAVIDFPAPIPENHLEGAIEREDRASDVAWFVGRDLAGAAGQPLDLPRLLAALEARAPEDRWRYAAEALKAIGAVPADTEPHEIRRLFYIKSSNTRIRARAMTAYDVRPYPGRITVLHVPGFTSTSGLPCFGWSRLSAAPVETHEVPGDHGTLFLPPHVAVLGDVLGRCLGAV
jgi:amino acid adenylation domain-containing protein